MHATKGTNLHSTPSRRTLFALLGGLIAAALARGSQPALAEPEELVIRGNWVLRRDDLGRLGLT